MPVAPVCNCAQHAQHAANEESTAPVGEAPISNDPALGKWQAALVLDDGTIVEFYQAGFDWEWERWKGGTMALQLELYNRDNDPDAHLVWGPDTDPPPEEPAE